MKARSNSNTATQTAKADPASREYREKVAVPTMEAVDRMPAEYRALVNEFGYVEIYQAWRARMKPEAIRRNFKGKSL